MIVVGGREESGVRRRSGHAMNTTPPGVRSRARSLIYPMGLAMCSMTWHRTT